VAQVRLLGFEVAALIAGLSVFAFHSAAAQEVNIMWDGQ
jgi:hypothetical protein